MPLEFEPIPVALEDPPPPRPILIPGILSEGDLVLITGLEDTFKSTFALELVYSLSTGRKFLGWFPIMRTLRCGIVNAEIDAGNYLERVAQFVNGDLPMLGKMHVTSDLEFDFGHLDELRRQIDIWKLDCVCFDHCSACWPERALNREIFSENQKTHVSPLLKRLKTFGKTFILIHHDPKASQGVRNRASGSQALLNDPDVRIFLDRFEDKETGDNNGVRIRIKNRLQRPLKSFVAQYDNETRRLTIPLML